MTSNVKGTHFAIPDWISDDDIGRALELMAAQLEGFTKYMEEAKGSFDAIVKEAWHRHVKSKKEGGE